MLRAWLVLCLLGLAASASAQTAVQATSKVGWAQVANSLTVANGYRYDALIDALPATSLSGVVCTGTASPFACTASFPATTPGVHAITLTATDTSVTPPLTSAASAPPISVRLVIAPSAPSGVTAIP